MQGAAKICGDTSKFLIEKYCWYNIYNLDANSYLRIVKNSSGGVPKKIVLQMFDISQQDSIVGVSNIIH